MGKAIWRGEFRWTTACMGFAAIFVFAFVIYSPTGSGLNEARYAAAATLVFLPFAAAINRRGILVVLLAAFAANLFYLVPLQWTSDDVFAAGAFAVAIVPFLLVAALMARYLWQRGRKEAGIAVAALITYCSLAFALEPIRQMFRHDIYTQASRARTYSNFPVGGNHGQSFLSASIFEHVDQEEPLRLAVTVGWDGRGINWFVYPLLGSRLQNRLDYVPVAKDGSLPPYKVWQRATVKGSYQAWYERIRAGGYDYVATFAPATMELSWMQRHPEAFELVAVGDHPANRLYLVKDR